MIDGVKALFDVNKKRHNKFTLVKGFILIINHAMETSCGKVFFIRPSLDGTYYGMALSVRPIRYGVCVSGVNL